MQSKHSRCHAIVVGVLAFVMLGACRGSESTAPDPNRTGGHFSLDVLPERVGVRYTYSDLTAALGGDASAPVVHITEADVASYVVGPEPSVTIELRLTKEANARLDAAIDALAETQVFVVKIDDRVGYEGVVYTPIGAAAIQNPVLHRARFEGRRTLIIGAYQGALMGGGVPGPEGKDAAMRRIDVPDARAIFGKRHALVVGANPPQFVSYDH